MKPSERESLHYVSESTDSEDESRRELRLDEEESYQNKQNINVESSSNFASQGSSSSMDVLASPSSASLEKPKIIDEDAKVFIEFASFFTAENMNNSAVMSSSNQQPQQHQPPPPPLMDLGINSASSSSASSHQIFSSGAAQSKPSSSLPSVIVSHHNDAPKPPSSMLIPIPIKTAHTLEDTKAKKTKVRSLHKPTSTPQVASSSSASSSLIVVPPPASTPVKRQTKTLREDDRIVTTPSKVMTQQIETPSSAKRNEDLPRKKRGRPPGTKKVLTVPKKIKEDYEEEYPNQMNVSLNQSFTRPQPSIIEMPQDVDPTRDASIYGVIFNRDVLDRLFLHRNELDYEQSHPIHILDTLLEGHLQKESDKNTPVSNVNLSFDPSILSSQRIIEDNRLGRSIVNH